MKSVTLILSPSWHRLVGGTYEAASEDVVDELEAGKISTHEDLSESDVD